jgi:hypothetical protein
MFINSNSSQLDDFIKENKNNTIKKKDLFYSGGVNDIAKLRCVASLDLRNCNNITFIGEIRNLHSLIIDEENTEGIHLLTKLTYIKIMTNYHVCNKKTQRRINKLKKINSNIIIEFERKPQIHSSTYNIARIMSGMGGIQFSH